MENVRSILTIVDKPKHEQTAIARAAALAGQTGAKLHLASFCWHSIAEDVATFDTHEGQALKNELLRERSAWLDEQCGLAGVADDVEREAIWTGDIAEWVNKVVSEGSYDLVVKSVHRSESLLHTPLDWRLIRECPASLLLTATDPQPATGKVVAALDFRHDDRDHHTLNLRVLDTANYFAQLVGGEVHCIYVVEFSKVLRDLDIVDVHALHKNAVANASGLLDAMLGPYDIPKSHVHIRDGKVGPVVNGFVREIGADVLVVGTSARRGIGAALIGNSAERILTKAVCDVLTVKP